jgi:hypothetical protein
MPATSGSRQGWSVALSADGNTAIVGGPDDPAYIGAAWVFTRSKGVWTQQGGKLVGTGAVAFPPFYFISVALSGDGNTAIVGRPNDNGQVGAAWVFTRAGGVWSQQGSKLVGTGAVGGAGQGHSLALSADGNTAIVGGPFDNATAGATWVFTRSGGVWSQQGSKLVGTGAVGSFVEQGYSVALSVDGNTAIVGGPDDNWSGFTDTAVGAAWVFTRSGGVWSQDGGKLVGTFAVGNAFQGISVALSADGNTAIVGGDDDFFGRGSAWVFGLLGGSWTQLDKLVGVNGENAFQGQSVALSADGNTAILGGFGDNGYEGAAWVFRGSLGDWRQQGRKLVGTGGSTGQVWQGYSVALSADGNTAIVGGPLNSPYGAAWVYVWIFPIKLNVTTTPSSGVTGTTDVNITGSGFPKGTLNPANVVVDLAASCGGPPLGTTRATSIVPIIGTSDRVQFVIPRLDPGLYYVSISDQADDNAYFSSANCSMLTVAGH